MNPYIYLVLPPIVIILGIAGMIYLISRRSSDIEKKKESLETEEKIKSTFKEKISNFFLRFLERLTRWFKIVSLRWHNVIENWLAKISEKRKKYADKKKEQKKAIAVTSDKKKKNKRRIFTFWKKSDKKAESAENNQVKPETEKEIPAEEKEVKEVKKRKAKKHLFKSFPKKSPLREKKKENNFSRSQRERGNKMDVVTGTVSQKIVYPEKKREKNELERILIERIAVNPKDMEAYERLGNYYEEIEEWSDAEACYMQVLKLSVNNYRVKIKLERVQRIIRKARYQ